jgi:hypothetical protein
VTVRISEDAGPAGGSDIMVSLLSADRGGFAVDNRSALPGNVAGAAVP